MHLAAQAAVAAAAAFAVALGVLAVLRATPVSRRVLDRPNERSMHSTPIPRIGGVGVLAGIVAGVAASAAALPVPAWAALAIVAAVSAADDLRGLSAATRLPLHLAAAAAVAVPAMAGMPMTAIAATVLAIAWSINLYNFMDGSDALAGSMAVVGFGAYAVAAAPADPPLALACTAIAGAAGGFLVFNLPPARIFMGDLGSTSLGLLAGGIGAIGAARGLWSPLLPAMVFMPFLFDASATLADRALRGRRVWEAHREHAYQRLNLGGLGHRRTALAYLAAMLVSAAAGLASEAAGAAAWGFAALCAAHAVVWLAVRRGWPGGSRRAGAAR